MVVAALDGTFQRKPFGKILELVPLAESVVKLSAVCLYCSKGNACCSALPFAPFAFLADGQPASPRVFIKHKTCN